MSKLLNVVGLSIGALAIAFAAVGAKYMIEDEADPFDDLFTPVSRAVYNYKKDQANNDSQYRKELEARVQSGNATAVEISVIANFKKHELDATLARMAEMDAQMRSNRENARTAPPISFRHELTQNGTTQIEQIDINARISKMESESDITEAESNSLKDAWATAAKTSDPKNTFKADAKKILSSNKDIGRDQAWVDELALKLAK